jgi:hypothetical protein
VQQLVIDPEGEFATLRERYDYVIAAAHGGDALAHPRTAQLLARRLLETGVSAILDIYDLKAHERQAFVRLFLEALVNAPRNLWKPCLVVLDEAHVYAPEAGKTESTGAVIDIATRGRKRGLCLVAATQRLAKLHKDCAAELLNKLIGRTGLDVDVARAADELGMSRREAMEQLRPLEPGNFFAFGPALSATVQRLKIGNVHTTHPKAGDRVLKAPPKPTAAIKAVLPKLADLPKEAEAEAKSVADLKRDLVQARSDLARVKSAKAGTSDDELRKAVAAAREQGQDEGRRAGKIQGLKEADQVMRSALNAALAMEEREKPSSKPRGNVLIPRGKVSEVMKPALQKLNGSAPLGAAARKILAVLAQYPEGCTSGKLALLTGYSYSGNFQSALSSLRTAGYMEGGNTGTMRITQAGLEQGPFDPLPKGAELLRYWQSHSSLGAAARKILSVLAEHPDGCTKEQLTEATGYEYSGNFQSSLSQLRTVGVMVGRNNEVMRLNENLFV